MDALLAAAARALAAGDPVGALKQVGMRDDPPALAMRGIAMAQLGLHPRARDLLRRAARAFGPHEQRLRARCVVAEAEVALAMRDLGGTQRPLAAAGHTLEALGDHPNAQLAHLVTARRCLLLGQLDAAGQALARVTPAQLPPALAAVAALGSAELALRALHMQPAAAALQRAHAAAQRSQVPALIAEVAEARSKLDRPAARCIVQGNEQLLRLIDVATLLASGDLVVDACRRGLRAGETWIALARRPVLFELARALAAVSPDTVERGVLIARVFGTRRPNDSHRARLRVEIGRLRALLARVARIEATATGYRLEAHRHQRVVVLEPPIAGEQAALVALLADGAAWSTSALALALGASQRTVQRALVELEAAGRVRSIRRARARRWLSAPLTEITTILLLPASLPLG